MKNIICMKWGDKFGAEYVNKLYNMVQNNLTIPHRFICFTDNSEGLHEGIEVRDLPGMDLDEKLPERGWRKLTVFQEQLADLKGQALFLDLDVVITDNIDKFFEVEGEFVIIKDWDFENDIIGNSSVFRFDIGKYPDVLTNFIENGEDIRKTHRNEQAYLSHAIHQKGILKYWPAEWCVSFKRNCLQKFPLNFFLEPKLPANTKILIFHGRPTPEQAFKGYCGKMGMRYVKPTKWLSKYWSE
ncbi:MAG: hypothetical protein R3Y28_08390 [Candidatus Gastranaerophilales bacterium]